MRKIHLLYFQSADIDLALLHLHGFSRSGIVVKPSSAYSDCTVHRRLLTDFSVKARKSLPHIIRRNSGCRILFEDFSPDVLRVRHQPEPQRAAILFEVQIRVLGDSGRLADANRKNTRCHRVKRSGMSDFLYAKQSSDVSYHIMRCHALRLVYI